MIRDWPDGLISAPTEALVTAATAANGSFSVAFPGMQTMLDSTSLGDFKRCPRYYFYSMICGLGSAGGSPHLDFGQYFHATVEHYHHARAIGMGHDDALDAALEWVLEATWERDLGRGWMSGHSTKNRRTLIQTSVWYLDQFQDDPIATLIFDNGKPAVEVSFRFDSGYRANGQTVMFCGHFDRIGLMGDEPVITDPKTTEGALDQRWFDKWTPGNQFSLYMLAGRVILGRPITKLVVDGIQVGAGFARFRRQIVPRSEEAVKEWHRDAGRWIGYMAECAARVDWPMNDKACDLFGGCQFRELCSRSPIAREAWAKASYKRRVWDPTKVRGDI